MMEEQTTSPSNSDDGGGGGVASENEKSWHSYISEDLPRTVAESTDSAIRSARSFQQNSSTHIRTLQRRNQSRSALKAHINSNGRKQSLLQGFIPQVRVQYRTYEDAFFKKIKDELLNAREHPAVAGGIVFGAFLLMRGPRRFLFRQTFGRFQSEEAQYSRAEKNVRELGLSVDMVKNERVKLLERATFAESEMKDGQAKLVDAGSQIQRLAKSIYKAEAKAADLMDVLREIPGRDSLKLRAEVASIASSLREQKNAANKKIFKISELGVGV